MTETENTIERLHHSVGERWNPCWQDVGVLLAEYDRIRDRQTFVERETLDRVMACKPKDFYATIQGTTAIVHVTPDDWQRAIEREFAPKGGGDGL